MYRLMDFNFVSLAKNFIKKNSIEDKEKTDIFFRKLEIKIKNSSIVLKNTHSTLFSIYDNLEIMKQINNHNKNYRHIIKSSLNNKLYISANFINNFKILNTSK